MMDEDQLRAVVAAVEEHSTNTGSYLHGPQHWKCVAKLGIQLACDTPNSDSEVAFLFGLFHDSMRYNDGLDPDHGIRAAELVRKIAAEGLLIIHQQQIERLIYACATHNEAPPSQDPVVGACYDADRLNLWRVGMRPAPEYISTDAGHVVLRSGAARHMHGHTLHWPNVIRELLAVPHTSCNQQRSILFRRIGKDE